jgi:4-hydroxybenzoate polyprenyltransferase
VRLPHPLPAAAAPPAPATAHLPGRWLLAWARERFPPRNAVFFAGLYVTALAVGRAAAAPGAAAAGPVTLGWGDAPGFVAVWAFFLVLRVCDEHKDFAADAVAHPGRVLQRGLVTLGDLRALGAAAVALQLGVSVWRDGGLGAAAAWWLAAAGWSALMAREFFAPAWLRRRLVAYALTHMLVMPLVVAWISAMAAPGAPRTPAAAACAGLAFAAGLAVEVARKLRAPADERPMADSYTAALGVRRAAGLLVAALAASAVAALVLTRLVAGAAGGWPAAVVAGATVAATLAVLAFARTPTRRAMRRAEAAAGVAVLTGHAVVLAALAAARGVTLA